MKKTIILLIVILFAISIQGCSTQQTNQNDIVNAINDISSDNDGNVVISLNDGRTFFLGN